MRISDWSSDVCSSDLYSLRTESVAPVMGNGKAISSSRIREALQTGDCAEATRLLTRPFAIEGVVQHGDKVGREIGYRSEEHTSELQSLMRISYAVFCLKKQTT